MTHTRIQYLRYRMNALREDGDVAWVIQLYKSRNQLQWCAPILREHYPGARVILISDGDNDIYEDIASQYAFEYIRGEHLMRLCTVKDYIERMLSALLKGKEKYFLRIDPDTRIWRRLAIVPAFTSVFGTLETMTERLREEICVPANVQGGCIGFTRDAAEEILSSGVINEESCVNRFERTWARCTSMVRVARNGKFADDHVISWAAHELGIPIVESSEIRSRWRLYVDNSDLRYAVTHPHKLFEAEQATITAQPSGEFLLSFLLKSADGTVVLNALEVKRPQGHVPLPGLPVPSLPTGNGGSWIWIGHGRKRGLAAIFNIEPSGRVTQTFISPVAAEMYLVQPE